MNKVSGFAAAFFLVSLLSCQDSRDEMKSSVPDISQLKTVGMKIPTETGARWIEAYNARNSSGGREGVLYSVGSAELQSALASVTDLVGVAFQYATDEAGQKHVIVIPVDTKLSLWAPVAGRVYLDANTNTPISQSTAKAWANRYQDANPSGIWFHYFGRNVFDEIISVSDFMALDIIPAINDLDLSPQLLLVTGGTENILGRTSAESNVYDASYPCPKCTVE